MPIKFQLVFDFAGAVRELAARLGVPPGDLEITAAGEVYLAPASPGEAPIAWIEYVPMFGGWALDKTAPDARARVLQRQRVREEGE